MRVRDVMTTDVVTCPGDETLREAVRRLLDAGVGSVILLDESGSPAGMVTETDVLKAAYRHDKPLSEIPVASLSHGPVITAKESETVRHVAHRMADNDVKKVPVMDDLDLVGIVTLTDIVWRLSDLRSEAVEIAEMNKDWGPKD